MHQRALHGVNGWVVCALAWLHRADAAEQAAHSKSFSVLCTSILLPHRVGQAIGGRQGLLLRTGSVRPYRRGRCRWYAAAWPTAHTSTARSANSVRTWRAQAQQLPFSAIRHRVHAAAYC